MKKDKKAEVRNWFIQAMEEMQRISIQVGTDQLSDKEIETEIRAARRGRRR